MEELTIGISWLMGSQSFVWIERVNHFKSLYLSGQPIAPIETYWHQDYQIYAVQDGHNRLIAQALLNMQLIDIKDLGERPFIQPHRKLYRLDEIKLISKEESKRPKRRWFDFS